MNIPKLLASFAAVTVMSTGAALAQGDPLPDTGIYFVISMKTQEALQANGPTMGQNALLFDFSKSGLQKWEFKRKIDLKTKKPTNNYTIRNVSDDNLYLQLPPGSNMACTVGGPPYTYNLTSTDTGILIKQKNGDALFEYSEPPMHAGARFSADDGSEKFRWKLINVNSDTGATAPL